MKYIFNDFINKFFNISGVVIQEKDNYPLKERDQTADFV